MTVWRDDIVQALENIGGRGSLAEIYEAVQSIRNELPENWQAIIRRELEYNSSDSETYQGKRDLFRSVDGIGNGFWALNECSENGNRWSDDELKACLEAYLAMLSYEASGTPYIKSEINEELRQRVLSKRSRGSIEFRMQNISAFFMSKNMPVIVGYKARGNIGSNVSARLENIYNQLLAETLSNDIDDLINPLKSKSSYSTSGYRQSAQERRAIEKRAMHLAKSYLEQLGYKCEDTSSNNPFDYLALKDGEAIKIEVKGTTASTSDTIMMTKNEVQLHRNERGRTALIIVYSILLKTTDSGAIAEGGILESEFGWNIDDWDLEPLTYQLTKLPS